MSTVRIYFFQNPPVELYQKIFITTYEPLRTTVLLLTMIYSTTQPYTYVTCLLPSALSGIPVRTKPATVLIVVRNGLLWAAGDAALCNDRICLA